MEYTLLINQRAAAAWELTAQDAMLLGYLVNLPPCTSGSWMRLCPIDPMFRWMANSKLVSELPLAVRSVSSARAMMAKLEAKGLIERLTHGNKSYFQLTDKALQWKSPTLTKEEATEKRRSSKPPESQRPDKGKPPTPQRPKPPESQRQSDTPVLSDKPSISDKPVTDDGKAIAKPSTPSKKKSNSAETWQAYAEAYRSRYGIDPLRNVQANAQMARFVSNVGQEHSPNVARFYLEHGDRYYVGQRHPVGLLLKDYQKLYTDWQTNHAITTAEAGDKERTHSNYNAIQEAKQIRANREARKAQS